MGRVSIVGGELCCPRQAPCRRVRSKPTGEWADEPLGEAPGGLRAHPAAVACAFGSCGRLKIMVALTAGDLCEQIRPVRNREAPVTEPQLA
jgi:hypothetical protein